MIKILGQEKVESILIKNVKTGQEKDILCQGIFMFVGNLPNTKFLEGLIKLDDKGYIITDDSMMSSREGIYACGEGATASFAAEKYIEELKGFSYK